MTISLRRLTDIFLDIVFPPRCVGCGREGGYLCSMCRRSIPLLASPVCVRCGRFVSAQGLCVHCPSEPHAYDGIRSVAKFEGPLRDAIHAFKYEGLRTLRGTLGELLAEGWTRFQPPGDVLVPVPLHARRMRERGYNQSLLLARELARHTGIPVLETALVRIRATVPQVGLDIQQRRANVIGAFHVCNDEIRDRAVLLIDDVYTTGATIDACAEALRATGALSIWALTLAYA